MKPIPPTQHRYTRVLTCMHTIHTYTQYMHTYNTRACIQIHTHTHTHTTHTHTHIAGAALSDPRAESSARHPRCRQDYASAGRCLRLAGQHCASRQGAAGHPRDRLCLAGGRAGGQRQEDAQRQGGSRRAQEAQNAFPVEHACSWWYLDGERCHGLAVRGWAAGEAAGAFLWCQGCHEGPGARVIGADRGLGGLEQRVGCR